GIEKRFEASAGDGRAHAGVEDFYFSVAPAEQPLEVTAFARERKRNRNHRPILQRGLERTISKLIGSLSEAALGVAPEGGAGAESAARVCRNCASAEAGTRTSTFTPLSLGKSFEPEPPASVAAST